MDINPTGRLAHMDGQLYLLLDRLFRSPVEEVWHSVTNPIEMEKWIGTYTGNPASGGVKFRASAEGEDAPWEYASILRCTPPTRFHVDVGHGDEEWRLFVHLHEAGGRTTLTLGHRLHTAKDAAVVGPGWDFYLDRLVAMRAGRALPDWERYHPHHVDYYAGLIMPAASDPGVERIGSSIADSSG
jgi:uncharacterized protein YndB with AHSA1/START domain